MSGPISRETVAHIAALARLAPPEEEMDNIAAELGKIVSYVEQLQELNTDDVEPLHNVLDMHTVLRLDEPRPSLPVQRALMNAPARKGDYFVVPRVVGGEE